MLEIENNPAQETSEAEAGGSSQENVDEESPMVSSQGSLPASPQQVFYSDVDMCDTTHA